jgi:hypothetical protein
VCAVVLPAIDSLPKLLQAAFALAELWQVLYKGSLERMPGDKQVARAPLLALE